MDLKWTLEFFHIGIGIVLCGMAEINGINHVTHIIAVYVQVSEKHIWSYAGMQGEVERWVGEWCSRRISES